jgi:hypothetical protein
MQGKSFLGSAPVSGAATSLSNASIISPVIYQAKTPQNQSQTEFDEANETSRQTAA